MIQILRAFPVAFAAWSISFAVQAIAPELNALNQLCRQATASGDYEEAAAVCRRARFDASKLAPGSEEHIASIVNEAELKVILNNHPDAVALYGYAVVLVEKKRQGSVEAAMLLARKAESQIYRGKNYEAEVILRRALQIREKEQGSDAIDTAVTRVRYGDVLGFLQQPFESYFAYLKALTVFENGGAATRDQYLSTRLRIAELLSRQSRFDEALSEFSRLMDDAIKPPKVTLYVATALDRLAWINAGRGNVDVAVDYYTRERMELESASVDSGQIALVGEKIRALTKNLDPVR